MRKDIKLRSVNTHFWDDNYIINLDPIEKLMFLYFLTNPLTNLAGIYEVSLRRIAFDTGIDKDMVLKIIERFSRDKKIYYKDGYIIIPNFTNHQKYNPSMITNVEKVIAEIPPEIKEFTKTIQSGDSLVTGCAQVEVEEEGEDKKEEEITKLISYWRSVYGNCLAIEQDFIAELNEKFGFSRTKKLIREFREQKFHKIPTMREALDNKGNIKTKEERDGRNHDFVKPEKSKYNYQ